MYNETNAYQNIANFPIVLSSLTTFAAFVISAKVHHKPSLTTAQAFTSLSLLQILIVPAALLLFAFPQVAQSLSCVSRIQKFLEAERHDDPRLIIADDHHDEKLSNEDDSNIINAKDLKLPYVKGKSEDTVLNFDIVKGSITVVIGVVGCGKSTLLKVLLGEQTPQAGSMSIRTPFMGFCAQSPWIQNKTIRENIIGPSELDKVWFRQVLHLCDLEADVNLMPNREETLVGSRGIVLSGGQKHRIVSEVDLEMGLLH
jgi:ABC-type bacteriocin/lantibiotic exporter with double-glycine peptidase domain